MWCVMWSYTHVRAKLTKSEKRPPQKATIIWILTALACTPFTELYLTSSVLITNLDGSRQYKTMFTCTAIQLHTVCHVIKSDLYSHTSVNMPLPVALNAICNRSLTSIPVCSHQHMFTCTAVAFDNITACRCIATALFLMIQTLSERVLSRETTSKQTLKNILWGYFGGHRLVFTGLYEVDSFSPATFLLGNTASL